MNAACFADLIDRHKIWVVQCRECTRLTLKTCRSLSVSYEMPRKNLQRDQSIQFAIACEIDFTHATGAEEFLDPVIRKLFADE